MVPLLTPPPTWRSILTHPEPAVAAAAIVLLGVVITAAVTIFLSWRNRKHDLGRETRERLFPRRADAYLVAQRILTDFLSGAAHDASERSSMDPEDRSEALNALRVYGTTQAQTAFEQAGDAIEAWILAQLKAWEPNTRHWPTTPITDPVELTETRLAAENLARARHALPAAEALARNAYSRFVIAIREDLRRSDLGDHPLEPLPQGTRVPEAPILSEGWHVLITQLGAPPSLQVRDLFADSADELLDEIFGTVAAMAELDTEQHAEEMRRTLRTMAEVMKEQAEESEKPAPKEEPPF